MATARRLWALEGAWLTTDGGAVGLGITGPVTIPVPAFLVEHDRGLVLFDTGFAPDAAEDPHGVYGDAPWLAGLRFTPEQRLDRQIQAAGFAVQDVTHVVVSHTHLDHTGGLYLFPKARFFAGAPDLPYAFWPSTRPARVAFRTADLEPTRDFDWHLLDGDHDLFDDGSVCVLSMPGHTPGNCSLLVRLPSQCIVLSGDTVHTRSALTEPLPTGWDYDTSASVRSIRRLRRIADSTGARVWVGHDPGDWKDFGGAVCLD